MPPHLSSFTFTPSYAPASPGIARALTAASSAISGRCTGFLTLLLRDLRSIDADRKRRHRSVPGVQTTQPVKWHVHPLPDPIHQCNIERCLRRELSIDRLGNSVHQLLKLPKVRM